ncbi:MAG: sortase B protein-sorting domain-containing protein, partial [Clostridiales bacterium]|nr:sortase B protein-sorting domain-containing protein [Clostridiales bacterium]
QSVLMDEYYYIHLPSGSVRVHPDYPAAIVPEKRDGLQTFLSYAGVKYRVFRGSLSELTTLVKAPAGAAQFTYDGGTQSVQNGYAKLTSDATVTNTQHYAITWQDQSGREISTEAMYISVNVYSSKPAVAERDDLNPLINGNQGWMGINAVARQVMTAQIGYKGVNGWMNIRMQGGPRMVWEDLQESRYVLRLKVPDGAKSLFVTELSEDIYEPLDDQQIRGMLQDLSTRPDENFDLVSGPEYIYQEGLLKNMTPGDPRIAVYAPYIPQDEDYGMVRLFFWYGADNKLISTYWALITTSDVGTFVTRPFHREADIRDRVEQPCFVDDRHDDWQLQSHYNPQSGNNAYQVELTLLDDSGLNVQPDGSTVFYLPYPDGMSYQNGATWTLRHYLDDGYETYETIQVTSTEYGLRFESSSLSPFVLLWDGGTEPQPAAAPKTGDSSPLALYAALTALSAALMVLLAARRKKA